MKKTRRRMLALGAPALLTLVVGGCAIVAPLAAASFPVHYEFPPGNGQLSTEFENGTVTVQQSAKVATPVLDGTAHYAGSRSTFSGSGNTVKYQCPNSAQCALVATLQLPESYPLSLAAHNSDVNIPSFTQDVTLDAGGGDVTAGTINGTASISTGGGDLTAGTLNGALNLSSENGDIKVNHMTGPSVQMNSGGGDVTVTALATLGTAKVESHGGDITVTCAKAPTNLEVNSGGGDITIVLPHGSYLFLHPDSSGQGEPPSDPGATNKVTVQSGGGDVTITEAS